MQIGLLANVLLETSPPGISSSETADEAVRFPNDRVPSAQLRMNPTRVGRRRSARYA